MHKITSPDDLTAVSEKLRDQQQQYTTTVIVSSGTCGQARGSLSVVDAFHRELDRQELTGKVAFRTTGCHGFCEQEPAAIIEPESIFYCHIKPEDVPEIVSETLLDKKVIERLLYTDPVSGEKIVHEADIPFYRDQDRVLLGQNKLVNPGKIEDYIAIGGYTALAKALTTMTPEEIIAEIEAAGLRGRGGGGFPTARKWEACRNAPARRRWSSATPTRATPART